MRIILNIVISILIICIPFLKSEARIILPSFITDSMVIQQQSIIKINGHASNDVKIISSWDNRGQKVAINAKGEFSASLKTPEAGGPYTITFDDGESEKVLHDIYSGEVWLCSGQSNMEMPLGGWGKVMNYESEILNASHQEIRMLQVKKQIGYIPSGDAEVNMGGWRSCSPTTVENFSSIAYFFARDISHKLNVHVGVIDCSWGGTPAEAWTSFVGVSKIPGFENEIKIMSDNSFSEDRMRNEYENSLTKWMGLTKSVNENFNISKYQQNWNTMAVPCEWEKSELPDFDGVVWLQCHFNVPPEGDKKPLKLSLGMIDDEDVVYYNGTKIGVGSGYSTPRHYIVPKSIVKEGEAVITIRVTDFGGGGGIWGSRDSIFAVSEGKIIPLAGNWVYKVALDFSALPTKPISIDSSSFPTTLYNAMLYPLHVLPIKGVLWYQGCANVGRDQQYSLLFRQLISDWRTLWNDNKLPFYFVQLASYLQPKQIQPDSKWAAMRKSQEDALNLENTAMAVTIDIGDSIDIHPKNKQEVARRLSLIAMHNAYGEKTVVCQAPSLKSCNFLANGNAVISFSDRVLTKDKDIKGFIVKLSDGTWCVPKVVRNNASEMELSSNGKICAVKYNWADYPNGNLVGSDLLPISQFEIEK